MLHNGSYRAANNNVADLFSFFTPPPSSPAWFGLVRARAPGRAGPRLQWVVNVSDVCMLDMALKRFCRCSIDRTRGIKYLYTLLLHRLHNGRSRRVLLVGPGLVIHMRLQALKYQTSKNFYVDEAEPLVVRLLSVDQICTFDTCLLN